MYYVPAGINKRLRFRLITIIQTSLLFNFLDLELDINGICNNSQSYIFSFAKPHQVRHPCASPFGIVH